MKPKLRQMRKDILSDVQIYIYYGKPFKSISTRSLLVAISMNHLKRIKLIKLQFFREIGDVWSSLYTESTENKAHQLLQIFVWPPVVSLGTTPHHVEHAATLRTWACCCVWKVLLSWLTSLLHSHRCSNATCLERPSLVLLPKRSVVFILCLLSLLYFTPQPLSANLVSDIYLLPVFLLERSSVGWGFGVFIAVSLAARTVPTGNSEKNKS